VENIFPRKSILFFNREPHELLQCLCPFVLFVQKSLFPSPCSLIKSVFFVLFVVEFPSIQHSGHWGPEKIGQGLPRSPDKACRAYRTRLAALTGQALPGVPGKSRQGSPELRYRIRGLELIPNKE
jgi:hypothetical protein